MGLQYIELLGIRQKAITEPEQYLKIYADKLIDFSKCDSHEISAQIKKEFKNEPISIKAINDILGPSYKSEAQRENALKRHREPITKEKKVKRFSNWLKRQPKSVVDEVYLMSKGFGDTVKNVDKFIES